MSVLSPLNELYQSLFSGIGQLPNVHYCGHYPNRMDAITVPAVLIDLVELEPGTDLGTEELVLVAHFEARVIMQSNVSPEPIQALVLSVLQWLNDMNDTPATVTKPNIKQALPDAFAPDTNAYQVWQIHWSQSLRMGPSVWEGEGIAPSQIWLGQSPNIGADHEPQYNNVVSET